MSEEKQSSVHEWIGWNQQGFLPGPEESEEDFQKRISYCLGLEKELEENVGADLPFKKEDKASQAILTESMELTQKLYGITPGWVPLFFSNYQLTPWHGGCAWIFQLEEDTPTAAFLQLRSCFRRQTAYLGLYQRKELIAHELAHVGRMLYQEPQFEEIFAYRSSASAWRRGLGPLIQSSKETLFFILILGMVIMADIALLAVSSPISYPFVMWLKLFPFVLVCLAAIRLVNRQRLFQRCLKNLTQLYQDQVIAQHVLYRLRDQEVKLFAHSELEEIRTFIYKQSFHSFRWRFLLHNYSFC